MSIIGITHEFGPWGPVRFLLLPPVLQPPAAEGPAFYVTTSRMCRGIHDWRCTMAETQTYGPLVLPGKAQADLFVCGNCGRIQPPAAASEGEPQVCLGCSDGTTVQHTGAAADDTAALAAAAALHGATGTLRHAKQADPDGYLALLDDTGDALLSVLEDAAWAIRQDPRRAKQTGYQSLALISRQILANARDYAELHTEPLPVTEAEEDETEGCEGHVDDDATLTSGAGIGDVRYCDGSCNPRN